MSAIVMDGKAAAKRWNEETKARADALRERGVIPKLAIVTVGDDEASKVYVRNKIKACETTGIEPVHIVFPKNVEREDVIDKLVELSLDNSVDGVILQLPLPKHLDASDLCRFIGDYKDVDGFKINNLANLLTDHINFAPCTPLGIMRLFAEYGIDPAGKHVVVVGRSNIVGKPMAMLMLNKNATVTICHSKTADLYAHVKMADIVIVAAGRPRLVTGSMLKEDAVVIDVGINRDHGKLVGDVDFASAKEVASYITPVPGGVGPMTVAALMSNTALSAEKRVEELDFLKMKVSRQTDK